MVWNPGDGTDLNEGGAGTDTTEVNGGNGAEAFTATASGSRVRFDRVNPAPFSIDIGTTESLVLNANGGDGNDLVNGGRGNDTALLGAGDDTFAWNPGDGSDSVEGQAGQDRMIFDGANVDENFEVS